MEIEDSRNALFCDPNAYIQKLDNKDKCEPRKIVFQEPYEQLPNFYLDNNFTKHNCSSVSPKQHKNNSLNSYRNHNNNYSNQPQHNYNCNHDKLCKNQCILNYHDCDNKAESTNNECQKSGGHQDNSKKQNRLGLDLKNLMPLLGMFNKGGVDLSGLIRMLGNTSGLQNDNNQNQMGLLSSVLSNKDAVNGILNIFKGDGLNIFNKKATSKKELKTTDYEIKNYTRVE